MTVADSASYAFSSSIAASALRSVMTPTVALAIRMVRMTAGSVMAAKKVSPFERPMMKSTAAAASRILTRRSSNCLRISFHSGVPAYVSIVVARWMWSARWPAAMPLLVSWRRVRVGHRTRCCYCKMCMHTILPCARGDVPWPRIQTSLPHARWHTACSCSHFGIVKASNPARQQAMRRNEQHRARQ